MNGKKSKLIKKFSKLGIIQDSRPQAMSNKPKKVIKKLYKSKNTIQRISFSKYMSMQIEKFRGMNVD